MTNPPKKIPTNYKLSGEFRNPKPHEQFFDCFNLRILTNNLKPYYKDSPRWIVVKAKPKAKLKTKPKTEIIHIPLLPFNRRTAESIDLEKYGLNPNFGENRNSGKFRNKGMFLGPINGNIQFSVEHDDRDMQVLVAHKVS